MKSQNFLGVHAAVFAGAANTEFAVTHGLLDPAGLPVTPAGYIVTRRSAAATLSAHGTDVVTSTGLTENFIAGWEFENAEVLGADSSGNSRTLTNSSTTQGAGQVGFSVACARASSQYLYRNSETSLQTGDSDFTFAAWVKLASKPAGGFMMVEAKAEEDSATWEQYLGYGTTADRFQGAVFQPSGVVVNADNLGSPSLDTWYFVIWWHDAAANTLYIQVNDGTANSNTYTGSLQAAGNGAFFVGKWGRDTPHHWDGNIDQLMFWKRVLTATERTWLYNFGTGRTVAEVLATEETAPGTATSWTSTTAYLNSSVAYAQFNVFFFA